MATSTLERPEIEAANIIKDLDTVHGFTHRTAYRLLHDGNIKRKLDSVIGTENTSKAYAFMHDLGYKLLGKEEGFENNLYSALGVSIGLVNQHDHTGESSLKLFDRVNERKVEKALPMWRSSSHSHLEMERIEMRQEMGQSHLVAIVHITKDTPENRKIARMFTTEIEKALANGKRG